MTDHEHIADLESRIMLLESLLIKQTGVSTRDQELTRYARELREREAQKYPEYFNKERRRG